MPDTVNPAKPIFEPKSSIYSFRFPLTRNYIFCHVLFVQIPHTDKRKSIQKSLILLTKNKETKPYQSILHNVKSTFLAEDMDNQILVTTLYLKFSSFPKYQRDGNFSLKFYSKRFDLAVTSWNTFPSFLRKHLSSLRSLWASLLMGESIVMYSEDVTEVTEAVEYLSSIISPLEYCGEIRPYVTMNDDIIKKDKAILVGTTNQMVKDVIKKNAKKVNTLDINGGECIHHIVDNRFLKVIQMNDLTAGVEVMKEFSRNMIEFLTIFDGFFLKKAPKMKSLEDQWNSIEYNEEEVWRYIKGLKFPSGKEMVYKEFIKTSSFAKYATDKMEKFEAAGVDNLTQLFNGFDMKQYTNEQIAKISINLFSLSKSPILYVEENAKKLMDTIVEAKSN
ncbi:hypothetical protein EIN_093740 [Entamoeba invadens IP1]|uniref:UDENN domain-containing protein n=1 Tax=Entamoeba invadens IP1 TaxID=370355 RepID=A0A0A1U001_ENTIV|nr:hypothetical protein EIN_093740 [Entamoeba invadens IP1]ELP87217.1 hypothetical protein EIN_093740 [Entamoeba invadens IP1]|eukprot:XP_004253988.1 hypothetical protein EIN_093740 [Entamoeba invadens IP1]